MPHALAQIGLAHLKAFSVTLVPQGGVKVAALSKPAQNHSLVKGGSAAIGSFDGVHLGHISVIEAAIEFARLNNCPSCVICFTPHPQSYFKGDTPPFRLMTIPQQLKAFEVLGVDYAVVLSFDAALCGLSPEDFVQTILKDHLELKHIVAGFDFTFGARGLGKANDLTRIAEDIGLTSNILACQFDEDGKKLSSSRVRDALEIGDMQATALILGHSQRFEGTVIKGDQKGRLIGFPTLNLDLGIYQRPKYGVYFSRTYLKDGRVLDSISNLGKRPTVDGVSERFETHLFDFAEDIYDHVVEIELLSYVRDEVKFASFEALKAQIEADARAARAYFKKSLI